jgi:ectoine hydroxylase-related dioxygenase (phytanoyl-CoA dioxygenase family)
VLLHGQNVHMSHENKSDQSRHAFVFHLVESHKTTWDALNWLQPSPQLPFPLL